jgi:putative nucleotidyltransferase with HDIG domain
MKKRILFVDDEPKVLEGLGRMLRVMRDEWEMRFATGGPEALEIMAAEPFDLVVTDMRMPVMNGLEFLKEVREKHPKVIRIMLSGHADQVLIMSSAGAAHQYLSKPCDAEVLRSTVRRAIELRELLANEKIKLLVGRMSTLPSLPSLYVEVVQELQSVDASVRHVGEIIAKDPGMTAKILQLVNSAFFGIRRRVSNPTDAVAYLGLETIQSLVLSVKVFSKFESSGTPGCSIDQISSHSLATAILAKRIAEGEHASKAMADEAFTAGLLHDLGKLLLSSNLPEQYGAVVARSMSAGAGYCDVEREILGSTHAEVGAYLMGLWGLPDPIVEAIALHHRPSDCAQKAFCALSAVHAANALEYELQAGRQQTMPPALLDQAYIAAIGKTERLNDWRAWSTEIATAGESK